MIKENTTKIAENTYLLSVNDRRTQLFENLWPLERGVSYNSYLIDDDKVTLIDTVESSFINEYIQKIKTIIGKKNVDYLIINHMEPDHSGAIQAIVHEFPEIQIIGNKLTFKILEAYYSINTNLMPVADGDTLNIGNEELKFFITPWVHWPETMMTYATKYKILFSGDAFGSFGTLNGGVFDDEIDINYFEDELRRYYSNIVGKFTTPTQKALQKLSDVDIKIIAATHGPIWRNDLKKILSLYNDWSTYKTESGVVIAYTSMYGNTGKMVDITARKLAENGIKNIRIYDTSKTHMSYIISDIWKFKGVIMASPTYNGNLHPTMECLVSEIKHLNIKNHLFGVFGSYSWSGAAMKELVKFAQDIKWDIVNEPFEICGAYKESDIEKFANLATNMAEKIKESC